MADPSRIKPIAYATSAGALSLGLAALNDRLEKRGIYLPISAGYVFPALLTGAAWMDYKMNKAREEGRELSRYDKVKAFGKGALGGSAIFWGWGNASWVLDNIGLEEVNTWFRENVDPAFGKAEFRGRGNPVPALVGAGGATATKAAQEYWSEIKDYIARFSENTKKR